MNIGTKIKELRNHNKITQEDLAKTLCISTQAVRKWRITRFRINTCYCKIFQSFN